MSKKEKIKNRITSLMLIAVLFSNFICSIALAASGGMVEGDQLYTVSYGTNNIEYKKTFSENGERVFFQVEKTGLYSIEILNSKEQDVTYELTYESEVAENSYNNNYVGLAVKKQKVSGIEDYLPVTQPDSAGLKDPLSTKIDVILLAGHKYKISFKNADFSSSTAGGKSVKIKIAAEQGAGTIGTDIKFSDIPSTHISLRERVKHTVYNPTKRDGVEQGDSEIPIITYGTSRSNFIESYLDSMGIKEEAVEEDEKGTWIEGAIVDIVLFIGEGILWLMEKALGLSEDNALTMDKLIFNRLTGKTAPIVDLRPLGGVDLGDDYDGILTDSRVNEAISAVYRGFKYLAIIIFIIVLLYIGIRIIMNVGTEKEAGSVKTIQYWFTGVILLFFVPYFMPVIPYLSNEMCKALSEGGEIKKTGDYTVTQVASELGEKYLGEDADVVTMMQKLQERIDNLNNQLDEDFSDSSTRVEDAKKVFENSWNSFKDAIKYENPDELDSIAIEAIEFIDSCYEKWDDDCQRVLLDKVSKIGDHYSQFDLTYRRSHFEDACRSTINSMFIRYKNSRIKLKIEMLESMQDSLVGDPMIMLKYEAKRTNRVVYAFAWILLMFQVFTLVFMYYKRLFVVLLLVVLYPVVVSIYALDKAGDKQAQSLKVWFQEFLANTTIQFVHSLVYILIINVGIDICKIDPKRYWLFLVIAVCFLFPAERILRNILGLKSSTLTTLSFSVSALLGTALAVKQTAGNFTRMGINGAKSGANLYKNRAQIASNVRTFGHDFKNSQGIKGKAKFLGETFKNNSKDWKSVAESTDKKRKKKQHYRDSRQQNRDYRLNAAKDSMNNIRNGNGTFKDRVAVARGAAAKVSQVGSNIATGVRESGIGRFASASVNVGKYAGKKLANGAKTYKRIAGTAAGLLQGMETMGDSGIGAGITVGQRQVHSMGGFKDTKIKRAEGKKTPPNPLPGGYNPVNLTSPASGGGGTSSRIGGTTRTASSFASGSTSSMGGATRTVTPPGGGGTTGSSVNSAPPSATSRPVASATTSMIRGALNDSRNSTPINGSRVTINPTNLLGDESGTHGAEQRPSETPISPIIPGAGIVATGAILNDAVNPENTSPLSPVREQTDMSREAHEELGEAGNREQHPAIDPQTGNIEVAGTRDFTPDTETQNTIHTFDATVHNEVAEDGSVVGTRIEGDSRLEGPGSADLHISAEETGDGGVTISTNASASSNPDARLDGENATPLETPGVQVDSTNPGRTDSSVSEDGDGESGEARINTRIR